MNKAILIDTNLQDAYLHGADLEGATIGTTGMVEVLFNADMIETNLKDVKFLFSMEETEEEMRLLHLSSVRRLRGSIMPEGTKYDGRFNLSEDIESARLQRHDINDPVEMAEYYEVSVEDYIKGQEWYKKWSLKDSGGIHV